MSVEFHPAVRREDLPAIYAYIARHNPVAAERVLDAVDLTVAQLSREPECGVRYPTRNRLLRDLRMLPVLGFSNYLLFHRVEGRTLRILYVVHGARHLGRFFRRHPRN